MRITKAARSHLFWGADILFCVRRDLSLTLHYVTYCIAQIIQALYRFFMIFTFCSEYKDHRYMCSIDGMEYLQLRTV